MLIIKLELEIEEKDTSSDFSIINAKLNLILKIKIVLYGYCKIPINN